MLLLSTPMLPPSTINPTLSVRGVVATVLDLVEASVVATVVVAAVLELVEEVEVLGGREGASVVTVVVASVLELVDVPNAGNVR